MTIRLIVRREDWPEDGETRRRMFRDFCYRTWGSGKRVMERESLWAWLKRKLAT